MTANLLTLFRILLAIPIITCIMMGPDKYKAAAGLFVLAVLTDALDGLAARRMNQETTFGAGLDLVADRILMAPILIFLLGRGLLEATSDGFVLGPTVYVVVLVLADLAVLVGVLLFVRLRRNDPDLEFPRPTAIVKTTYPVQAGVVLFALLQLKPMLIVTFMYPAFVLTVISIISYLKKGGFIFARTIQQLSNVPDAEPESPPAAPVETPVPVQQPEPAPPAAQEPVADQQQPEPPADSGPDSGHETDTQS